MADQLYKETVNREGIPAGDGTKVTTDPASNQRVQEGTGIITSDSLAGESINSGGAFASKNPGAGASSQPSRGTTTNNTDISGATILDAAPDAEARQATEAWDESAVLSHGKDLGKSAGVGPTYNTAAGGGSGFEDVAGTGARNAGAAPSYAGDPYPDASKQKPHGKNITEGGFDSNAPNASFNTDIGGKNDPGRFAEQSFQRLNAQSGLDAGSARDAGVQGTGTYDALQTEEQAPDSRNL